MNSKLPDTYSVPVQIKINKPITNNRYKHFNQTHFTIGDEEQFWSNRTFKNFTEYKEKETTTSSTTMWKLSHEVTYETFKYIFYKFKKGILIQIRNNKVDKFLPFSNVYFVNEWYNNINTPPPQVSTLPTKFWYTNNGLMRFESPINETDTGMCQMKHMFEQLCLQEKIPDIDLFVNRRDFPILKKDRTEPYDNIWNSSEQPLVSYNYKHYSPILSMVECENFADVSIPTMDDWSRVMYKENIHFAMSKRKINLDTKNFDFPWYKKKEIAVFRGSSTGLGIDISSNKRLRLCHKNFANNLLNVGITSKNERYRKISGLADLQKIDHSNIVMKEQLTLEEQSTYKYIIHIEGHVQAFRLSIELAMGSVILLVDCKYKLWFEKYLKPYIHYVPVKSDLSDLIEQINWCIHNDSVCKEIAKNARIFYDSFLSKEGCLRYLKDVIIDIYSNMEKNYNPLYHPMEQMKIIRNYINHINQKQQNTPSTKNTKKSSSSRTYVELVSKYKNLNKSPCTKIIYKSSSTTIYHNNGDNIVRKNSKYIIDYELFIGMNVINRMLQNIPNFIYTIPKKTDQNTLYLEYIRGYTMYDYIKSNTFNMNNWIFYTIQVLLSLSVAQRMYYFSHNNLLPTNIILYSSESEINTDYLCGINDSYRIFTKTIPVIIDFDRAQVIYDLQLFSKDYGKSYKSYQDCISYFISCIYLISKKSLHDNDRSLLLKIFKIVFNDDIYVPNEILSFNDMIKFVSVANNYNHINFSNKGKLDFKTPTDILGSIINLYRPCFVDGTNQCVVKIDSIEWTNFGKFNEKILPNDKLHPILQMYWKQKFYTDEDDDDFTKTKTKLLQISLPIINLDTFEREQSLFVYHKHYLNYINILTDLLAYRGIYELEEDEKLIILNYLKPLLNNRTAIIDYSRFLINFKIERNIFF